MGRRLEPAPISECFVFALLPSLKLAAGVGCQETGETDPEPQVEAHQRTRGCFLSCMRGLEVGEVQCHSVWMRQRLKML